MKLGSLTTVLSALVCAGALVGCDGGDQGALTGGTYHVAQPSNGKSGGAASGSNASSNGDSGSSSNGSNTSAGTTSGTSGTSDPNATAGDRAVSRAREWVAAAVPYCGGPNGGKDVICGGTCERSGDAANPAWDPYRSDCSGLVSYAWDLPAPGHTTSGFAPFATDVSDTIAVDDLQPGDALNNDTHVMLFAAWTDDTHTHASIIQESDCGKVASEKVLELVHESGSDKATVTYYGTFYAIRQH